ncbi:MAG: prephenate dehydratase domain-containing protein, partial [Candidatus Omnitrophota bacterium]
HNLMSREKSRSKIKKVYSVPQVFGQCRMWLEANLPGVDLIEVSSTAKAAEMSSREKGVACIGSRQAGEKYGLNLLSRSIEDSTHNVTRFLVIGRTDAKATEHDKTSLVMSIKDKVGGLHNILVTFKKHKLNLTKIESRPSKTRAWEYYFFIDVEGHYSDPCVAKALEMLKKETTYLKILGSYPSGTSV